MTQDNLPNSILSDADPMTLEELLARNPGELTPQDMDLHLKKLIPLLRAQRKELERKDNEAHKSGKYGYGPNRDLPEGVETLDDLFGEE